MIITTLVMTSCQPTASQTPINESTPVTSLEPLASPSFLVNCRELKNSNAFRANFYLCAKHEAWAGICMDLEHRLYMVVWSKPRALMRNQIDEKFRRLQVPPGVLRARMAPDAFVLDGGGSDEKPGVFRIPEDAGEFFGIELINHLFNLELKPEDQSFQWD